MTRSFPLADAVLARRIERAGVEDMLEYVEAGKASGLYPDAAAVRVGSGAAIWLSACNVVNGAMGLGMQGPVNGSEVDSLVAFYETHGSVASIDVCPLADTSLLAELVRRGFSPTGFESVLYRPLPARGLPRPASGVVVRRVKTAAERATWAQIEARGFTDEQATEADHRLTASIAAREDALLFLGYLDGEPAGTGMLCVAGGIARLNGDATLPGMRNRGVQTAILAERLRHASRAGCDLACIEAAPGSTSQRNQERLGFRVAYTRVTLVRRSSG